MTFSSDERFTKQAAELTAVYKILKTKIQGALVEQVHVTPPP